MQSKLKVLLQTQKITGRNDSETYQFRMKWINASDDRKEFLVSLVKMGMRGGDYSRAVIEFDKQHQRVFHPSFY